MVIRVLMLSALTGVVAGAEPPIPTLDTIFPTGASAGSTVSVEIAGRNLQGLKSLAASLPGFQCEVKDATHCEIRIPDQTPAGLYDLWAVCDHGITSPRSFTVSRRQEVLEPAENNNAHELAADVPLNSVINGRIETAGDVDFYRFAAKQGQRVILACRAERIDSSLRAVLELFDENGRRLAANRGYDGVDPLIDFRVPAEGNFVVKIHDLLYSGGAEHFYRLEIDAGPRVAFTLPNVIPRGQASQIQVFGWNLSSQTQTSDGSFDRIDVEIPAEAAREAWPLPLRLSPTQLGVDGFAYHHPGSDAPVFVGVTDVPVQLDGVDNHSPQTAQTISIPCEVSGQLAAAEEVDWFALEVSRGEVLHFDVLSQRLGAPTDLQLSVWDAAGENLLADWNDEFLNRGGAAFPTNHYDPSGRWVAPADGLYLLAIRNLRQSLQPDPRRTYRLSIRREETDFHLFAMPRTAAPAGFNVRRGGRFAVDLLAVRQRGMQDAIRVSAKNLPVGVECSDVVLGPGVDRATLVISAAPSVESQLVSLELLGHAESVGERPVRGGTVIRAGTPNGWSRLVSSLPLMVSGESAARLTAAADDELNHHLYGKLKLRSSPGSVLDVAVTLECRDSQPMSPVKLTGVGLPPGISNAAAIIPAGESRGVISFYLPPTLTTGAYSLAIRAETALPTGNGKTEPATLISNAVTFVVEPAAFRVAVDPFAPRRVKRGETFQVAYSAERTNGFIGKIHTELASPGVVTDVPGLRGRGVTFTGQSEEASIQVVVNDNAPLGAVPFLRLFGVGVVEDTPTYFGAALFPLEIVE